MRERTERENPDRGMSDALPREDIAGRLDALEREEDVRIVYAVESGSRAWGFASTDSDYDVRFLYLHRPDWYLRIDGDHQRDVIERPIVDEIDLSGWDLQKALGLFFKSNPPLYEWLRSPLIYREVTPVALEMRDLASMFYDPRAGFHHYLHMAQGNYRGELAKEQVRHKKYFYVLRPVLACRWIDAGLGVPPMEFEHLLDRFLPNGPVRRQLDELLAAKRAGVESDSGPRLEHIHTFLEAEFQVLERRAGEQPKPRRDIEPLNTFFRTMLREVWSDDPLWQP